MDSRRRWTLLAASGVLAVSLTCAALAWACIPSASISLSPTTGPPGTAVTVTGNNFPSGATVNIHWSGSGGQTLASTAATQSGTIATTITIPSAPADVYTISASVPGEGGGPAGAFTIPGPAASPPDGSPSPAQGRQADGSADSPSGPHTTSGTASGGDGVDGRGGGERSVAGGGERGLSGTRDGGVVVLPSGTSVFADSVTPSALRAADGEGRSNPSERSRSAVSEASAASDLWSGFGARVGDEFLDSGADAAETSGSVPTLSLMLLALGIVTASAGAGVAAVRSRRARAKGGATSD